MAGGLSVTISGHLDNHDAERDRQSQAQRDTLVEPHGNSVADFGIGFAYPLDPGKSSVITSVGLGDPANFWLWKVVHGDDRGGDWNLSVVVCDSRRSSYAPVRSRPSYPNRIRLPSTRVGLVPDQLQPLHDLLQLLLGIDGVDEQAVRHTMLLEKGGIPGEDDTNRI